MTVKVKVNTSNKLRATIKSQDSLSVRSAISGKRISELDDTDFSNLQDGSVLVYSTNSGKWESTILLEKQTVECGQY